MPNFEREVQRIIAEQEIGSKVGYKNTTLLHRTNTTSNDKQLNGRWRPIWIKMSLLPANNNSMGAVLQSGKRNW